MQKEQEQNPWRKIVEGLMRSERGKGIEGLLRRENAKVYPNRKDLFSAFRECPHFPPKAVIIGQDPYYYSVGGVPVADGMAFSSKVEGHLPQSLSIIFEELDKEYCGFPPYTEIGEPNLSRWANQGVLLLNSSLTVRHNSPGSHESLWKGFIPKVLESFDHRDTGFILLGRKAHEFRDLIKSEFCMSLPHPAVHARSGIRPGHPQFDQSKSFLGSNCFRDLNLWLHSRNLGQIDWLGL